jgi:hypothetical protein
VGRNQSSHYSKQGSKAALFAKHAHSKPRAPRHSQPQHKKKKRNVMSDYTRKILLSFTPELVATLDTAAQVLGMCRSDVIRRSLVRDLDYVMRHEVPNMQRFHQETSIAHTRWLSSKR